MLNMKVQLGELKKNSSILRTRGNDKIEVNMCDCIRGRLKGRLFFNFQENSAHLLVTLVGQQ